MDVLHHQSRLRVDDNLLVNPHVFGLPASVAPVMHLRRREGGRVAQTYLTSLERWNAPPIWHGQLASTQRPVSRGASAGRGCFDR